jgi:hypothetical protein
MSPLNASSFDPKLPMGVGLHGDSYEGRIVNILIKWVAKLNILPHLQFSRTIGGLSNNCNQVLNGAEYHNHILETSAPGEFGFR